VRATRGDQDHEPIAEVDRFTALYDRRRISIAS